MSETPARRHKRYPVSWKVEIKASSWDEALQLTTDNVSRGGLFIRCNTPPPIGTELEIELSLPDETALRMSGVVMHAISSERADALGLAPGFGLRFNERHAIDLNLLEGIASVNAGGQNSFLLDKSYITLPAILLGQDGLERISTAAYHLILEEEFPLEIEEPQPRTSAPRRPQSTTIPAAEIVFGIDFGTSYSSIALAYSDRVSVLATEEGKVMIPSVVCYPESGPPLVGWPAREKLATCPATTLASPKRLIGRSYDDPQIQQQLATTAVRMKSGPAGQVVSEIYGETIAIPQVCAEIFRHLATIGEREAGTPVRRVALSVPVGISREREAIRRAAELAGLEVANVIEEPLAAALAYGLNFNDEGLVVIYDFGGGTFDVALLHVQPGGGVKVLAVDSDPWLGGDDFDRALAEYAATVFWRQRKIDLRTRQVEWQLLQFVAENAKLKLSLEEQTELLARGIMLSIHGPIDLRVALDRKLLSRLCGELVERSITILDGCLRGAGLRPEQINQVVLTGDTSRSPLVRQRLQSYFQREILLKVDPELAVVTGAAIYGRYLAQRRVAAAVS